MKALDFYRIEREDKAGIGYVDFIFYPFQKNDDAIIIELKVNHSADEAIQQIKDRQYALRFEGKFGEKAEYTGRILAVGIAYHKDDIKNFMNVRWRFFVRKLSDAVFLSMIFINFFSSLIFKSRRKFACSFTRNFILTVIEILTCKFSQSLLGYALVLFKFHAILS